MITIKQSAFVSAARAPEVAADLAQLNLELIRLNDSIQSLAGEVDKTVELVRNSVAKSYLSGLSLELRVLGSMVEPMRVYAWDQLKQLSKEEGA